MAYIEIKNEHKRYQMGETIITANGGISFEVEKGEVAVILGPSGVGKSAVLSTLSGIGSYDEGEIIIDGADIAQFSERQLITYRRNDTGFVFQFYNSVPNLTAKENVELASQIAADALDPTNALQSAGLGERLGDFLAQPSGGEQQRVTIARAVAKGPKLLLCDEPTGALDYETGKQILTILQSTAHETGTTALIITYNSATAEMTDRVIRINNAEVREMTVNDQPELVAEIEW